MFKRSLLSLVLVTASACPVAIAADIVDCHSAEVAKEVVDAVADNMTEAAKEVVEKTKEVVETVASSGVFAQTLQFIKDNKLALGAGLTTAAGAVALVAWYYGYFQTAENNEVA